MSSKSSSSGPGGPSGGWPTLGRGDAGQPAGAGASDAGASGSLYERYKDALRRGHVAALRGRNDAAIDAYGEAAMIAPDRALPHASIGGIFVKMGRLDQAITAYDRALELGPRDEGALRGIAEAFTRAGRRTEAAEALDRLGEVLDAAGRLADACDAARRALELAESRVRRRQVEAFATRLRVASPGDEAAQRALDQALRILEPTAPAAPATPSAEPEPVVTIGDALVPADSPAGTATAGETAAGPDEREAQVATEWIASKAASQPEATEPQATVPEAREPEVSTGPEPEPEVEPVPESEPMHEPAGLGIALGAVAEAALHAGDLPAAREGLLAAARAHRRAGRLVAAVDACDLAISIAPADPDVHLLLVEIYLDRGWRSQAADKLLLLGRLADLDADESVRQRLCDLVTARLPDEPRVAELCA
jgi:tetratricopeptide (TPR) repeat protein